MTDYAVYYSDSGWSSAYDLGSTSDTTMRNYAQNHPLTYNWSGYKEFKYDPVARGLISKTNNISSCTVSNQVGSTWANSSSGGTTWKWYDGQAVRAYLSPSSTGTLYRIKLAPMYSGDWLGEITITYYIYVSTPSQYTVSFAASNSSYGSVSRSSCTVYSGATISSSGSTCTVSDSYAGTSYACTATAASATNQYTYSFTGWTGASGSVTSAKTITANFTRSTRYYTSTLQYNANGGSGAPSAQSNTSVTYGSSASFTVSSTTPTRSGYTFLGWSTSSTASSASYTGGSSISVAYNSTTTLYAVWKSSSFTLRVYRGNWGSFNLLGVDSSNVTSSSKTYTVNEGDRIDVDWYGASSEYGGSQASGRTYVTTYDSSCYNMAYTSYGTSQGDSVIANSSHPSIYPSEIMGSSTTYTFYYTIAYDANGGTGAPSNTDGGSNSSTSSTNTKNVTVSSTRPTRSGFNFLGWSTSSTATTATYQPGTTYSFSYGTIYLFAVWEASEHTVTFAVTGSGSVSNSSLTVTDGSAVSSSGNTVTIGGTSTVATPSAMTTAAYNYFTSWSNVPATVTADVTITANFSSRVPSTVTLEMGGNYMLFCKAPKAENSTGIQGIVVSGTTLAIVKDSDYDIINVGKKSRSDDPVIMVVTPDTVSSAKSYNSDV